MMAHAYDPNYLRGVRKMITVQGLPWAKVRPIQKLSKAKKICGVDQMVECLLSEVEILIHIPVLKKKYEN
jgi:hypothetical protein